MSASKASDVQRGAMTLETVVRVPDEVGNEGRPEKMVVHVDAVHGVPILAA